MKKVLLSVMSIALLSVGGASAQNLAKDIKGVSELAHAKALFVNADNGVKAKAAKKIKSNEALLGYAGAETPVGFEGFPSVADASAVAAQIQSDNFDFTKYNGYKIVGMRFAVMASLGGDSNGVFVWVVNSDNTSQMAADLEKVLADGDYKISSYETDGTNITKLNTEWNDVYFDDTYTISDKTALMRYGYMYTQNTEEESDAAYPIMFGTTSEYVSGQYIIYGTFKATSGTGWYSNANAQYPYTPCIQLIAQDPNGETAIIGVNGETVATAKQYYTLDGKQLSAPQKGLNIVKMSDGTTTKVVVK